MEVTTKQGKQPVFASRKHLKVIVMATVKVIVMARTMRGKTLLEQRIKEFRLPTFWVKRHYTCAERLLGDQKSGNNARP